MTQINIVDVFAKLQVKFQRADPKWILRRLLKADGVAGKATQLRTVIPLNDARPLFKHVVNLLDRIRPAEASDL